MPGNLFTNTPARDASNNAVQAIVGRHTLTAADTPASTKIGTLPAGSLVIGIASRVVTAITGGTPVFGVSYVATVARRRQSVRPAICRTCLPKRPAAKWCSRWQQLVLPLTTDIDIYIGTTGAATAGDAIVAVLFVKPLYRHGQAHLVGRR